ncbi:MAG: hypothetical protein NTY08_00680 [Proteobacteria bacterium]|nr:hypothetical protein [Pseudomonadota bacterium]
MSKFKTLRAYLLLGSLNLIVCTQTLAAPETGTKLAKATKSVKPTKSTTEAEAQPSDTPGKSYDFGLGVGFFNLFLPLPAAQATYIHKNRLYVGTQVGYLTIPLSKFSAQSTYIGIDAKYLLFPKGSFYVGAALGQRNMTIGTISTVTINDTETEVIWTRKASQILLIPRVGWIQMNKHGFGSTISLGLVLPAKTNFSVSSDPTTVPGLTQEDYDAELISKGKDVSAVTNIPLPHVELSFFWYLNVLKRGA